MSRLIKTITNIVADERKGLLVCLAITLMAFINVFPNTFVVDDFLFIVDWPLIQDLENFPQFFGPNNQPVGEEGIYSPLKIFFHAISYAVWGLNPFGHHLMSLIIHLAATFFVYRIILLLSRQALVAFLGTLFFGIHPIHVEPIASMTGTIDTIGVLFLFISFYYYIKSNPAPSHFSEDDQVTTQQAVEITSRKRKIYYIDSCVFALLAIFTHELCITLPILYFIYDAIAKNKGHNNLLASTKRVLPFFIMAAFYVFLKWLIFTTVARGGYLGDSFYLTMLVVIKSWAKYIWVFLFPFTLAVNRIISPGIHAVDMQYFDPQAVAAQSIWDIQVLASLLLLAGIMTLAVKSFRSKPVICFGIGWFFISLLPTSNIIPTGTYYAERYLYPGSLGLCFIYGHILSGPFLEKSAQRDPRQSKKQIVYLLILLTIIPFYFIRTVWRNTDFRNTFSLYQAEIKANPSRPDLWMGLGLEYLSENEVENAKRCLSKALRLDAQDPDIYIALAETHIAAEEMADAEKQLLKAIEIAPRHPEAHFNLAVLYGLNNDRVQSKQYFDLALTYFSDEGRDQEAQDAKNVFVSHFGKKFFIQRR